ncbi:uncharacterized protein BCR38DRAFT_407237 [Pseudomassariella vexata]|uniref:Uncharacterized protein n=1 Tax=Pseudomassariella vexata TaxID=1141098 RepID=A0A1Y2E6Q7_9PEZI|nr:uncharacterized protein BCR38DRAFT_407237 [Pseudomassariella vexata]ORY67241.1 hypothetical protein BCR38DRAFT_407237 [Pseudomassariella vexata]
MPDVKLFFLIAALDEYEGRPCQLLLPHSTTIQKMDLQDLTEPEITGNIDDIITIHGHMTTLSNRDSEGVGSRNQRSDQQSLWGFPVNKLPSDRKDLFAELFERIADR